MPILDCNTIVGSWPFDELDLTPAPLLAGMEKRGVSRSVVTHTAAIYYDTSAGNDAVLEVCQEHKELVPTAVINPLRFPLATLEVLRCQTASVKIFRFCPREHGYPFSAQVGALREVLTSLEAAKLLLVDLVDMPEPGLSDDIAELLPAPTVFTVRDNQLGAIFRAASQSPRVLVETSHLTGGGVLEMVVRHMGQERVLFGSGAPLLSIGSAVTSVQYAEFNEETRQGIFEGNLARVMQAD